MYSNTPSAPGDPALFISPRYYGSSPLPEFSDYTLKLYAYDMQGKILEKNFYPIEIDIPSGYPVDPEIKILQPNGGEIIYSGSSYEIKWNVKVWGYVKQRILYSLDGGNTWTLIIETGSAWNPATTQSYVWNVPSNI